MNPTTTCLLLAMTLLSSGFASAQSPVTTAPYVQDFDAGPLGSEWQLNPDPLGGRVAQSTDGIASPGSGGLALLMDSLAGGPLVMNEAVLHVDLVTSGIETLIYSAREVLDEEDPGEGLWISDGVIESLVFLHSALTNAWTEVEIDLLAAAAGAGISTGSSFRIIFRQFSDNVVPFDGILIDDVRLLPPDDDGQANQVDAYMDLSGGLNANGRLPEVGRRGPFFAASSVFDLEIRGEPGRPWLLLLGPLNVNNAVFPNIGSLDLGQLAPNLGDITVLLDGNSPADPLDAFAVLGPTGVSHISFGLSSYPPGHLGTFQAAVYVSGPDVLHLTAAFDLVVVP